LYNLLPAGITDIINFLSMSYYKGISSSKRSTEGVSSSRRMGVGRPVRSILAKEAERMEDLKDLRRERKEMWREAKKEAERRGERIFERDDGGFFRTGGSTPHRDDDSSVYSEMSDSVASYRSRYSESSSIAIARADRRASVERRRREKAEEELRSLKEKERRREKEAKDKSRGVLIPHDDLPSSSSGSKLESYGLKPKGTPAKSTALTPVSGRGPVPVGPTLVVPDHTPGFVYPTGPFGPGVVVGGPVPYPGVVAVDPFGGVVVGGPVVGVPECGGFISYGDGPFFGMH
jgi:hypothetical protein